MEQSLLANHERQFATPHGAWHELLATEMPPERERLLVATLSAYRARRHEPKAGADLGTRPTQAVRLRTAGKQRQRFEIPTLKPEPPRKRESSRSAETQPRLGRQ